tara:strand:- start:753 stop:4601 length:3849 start_codon:yes stop_codon:yes gene_type:complete
MISSAKNKRIYKLNGVFRILIIVFFASYNFDNQIIAQNSSEVIEVSWTFEQTNEILDQISPTLVVEFPIQRPWPGVEILDQNFTWAAFNSSQSNIISEDFQVQRPEWRVVRGSNTGEYYAQARFPAFRNEGPEMQRLVSWSGVIAESPATQQRIKRNWPEHSALSEGVWVKFRTTKEGVHRIEYSDLLESGISPENYDFNGIHVYGGGGKQLPFLNNTERALDLPLLPVKTFGADDGVFNQGDVIYFHASGVDSWTLNENSGWWNHSLNPWSDYAYYYVRLDGEPNLEGSRITDADPINDSADETFNKHLARRFHEIETTNLAKSGREFYNEHFTSQGSQIFSMYFNIPNLVGDTGYVESRIAGRTIGTTSDYTMLCNGESYTTSDLALTENSLLVAQKRILPLILPLDGEGVNVQLSFMPGNSEAEGWIDYVSVQAFQELKYYGGQFHVNGTHELDEIDIAGYNLKNAESVNEVWDVTEHLNPRICDIEDQSGDISWDAIADTTRRFVAFKYSSAFEVESMGLVQNSDIHSLEDIDLVILTSLALDSAANRLANLHANEGMTVAVVNQREIWNSFSSGSPDPTALKMLMMMLRDKAESPDEEPKHLLLMGDGSYFNRNLNPDGINLLTFQSSNSESTVSSYVTDDYFGLLEDGAGEAPGDKLTIGVGRIPAPNLESALAMVSKIETYLGAPIDSSDVINCLGEEESSKFGVWRNKILFVTDDQDGNNSDGWRHMSDSEVHSNHVIEDYNEYDVIKIYPDAYVQESTPGGERYDEAEAEIQRKVEEGALIVDYIGHGGARGWAHERILNTTTIREWTNKNRLPVFMTATCELSRYDDPDEESAGEMLIFNPNGGAVGMLTTTRTVFSGGNQELNTAFFQTVLDEDAGTGQMRCLGDICKDTKNSDEVTSTVNMRNFSLLGDPAMMLAYPSEKIFITEIPDTIKSLDLVTIRGYIGNSEGDTLSDFNGRIYPKLFDKRSQLSTLDNDEIAGAFSYSVFRNIIYKGLASVENGEFSFQFVVPKDIDYTYGHGRISCYAYSDAIDAHGASEDFIIGGTSNNFLPDEKGPDVHLYMNDSLFVRGGLTSDDPWLYARVFDESGINTVGNGIGHDLKAVLDDDHSNPYILNSYFSADLDTYKSGTVRFPFNDLEDGEHNLVLKVWDVHNNSVTDTTEFIVANSIEVALEQVIAFPNPAIDNTTFRFSHNQECQAIEAKVNIYDSDGKFIRSYSTNLHAHGSTTDLLTWDLTNDSGSKVDQGVYLFKIELIAINGASAQYGSKVVVVGP